MTQKEIQGKCMVVGISPEIRLMYRMLRRTGFSRHDANMMASGAVMATGEGRFMFKALPS